MKASSIGMILIASCASGAWAQVYKCPDASGKTVIQQMPCAGGKAMDVRPASGHSDAQAAGNAQARLEKMKADNETAAAIRNGKPLIGMTVAQLQQAMGPPNKVNQGNYGGTQKDQAIFYRPNGTWYIYTTNGVVESMQFQEGAPIGQAAQGPPCPSAHELRDAGISAGSTTASRDAVMRYQALLDAERDCRR